MNENWFEDIPVGITVSDAKGKILLMNTKSGRIFEKSGGKALIGKNLLECHPQLAQEKILHLMQSRECNAYTIEKNGIKKLIYQCPWYEQGEFGGLVEFSLEIPFDMPHFIRK